MTKGLQNDLVDSMNNALRTAVLKQGSEYVHFIEYDSYVGSTNGRYCQPNRDESKRISANRQYLFFFEMQSRSEPRGPHDELKRRDNTLNNDGDIQPANGTLNALLGALVQQAIDENPHIAIMDSNSNFELEAQVNDELGTSSIIARDRSNSLPHATGLWSGPRVARFNSLKRFNDPPKPGNTTFQFHRPPYQNQTKHDSSNGTNLGTFVTFGHSVSPADFGTSQSFNQTSRNNGSFSESGLVIANDTHILLASSSVVEKVNLKKLIVSDDTSRVFHPTTAGHALIAHVILYQMKADRARSLGTFSSMSTRNY